MENYTEHRDEYRYDVGLLLKHLAFKHGYTNVTQSVPPDDIERVLRQLDMLHLEAHRQGR